MPLESICDDYFSSISPLASKIVTEKREKINDYGYERWEALDQDEKDERLNEWFMDERLTHKYQIQLGSGFNKEEDKLSTFPRYHVKTGQRMVHHTDHDGSQSKGTMLTWRDEFSSPFTWETSCQQTIPLPTTENISMVLPRENELLDSGWKEDTVDGLEDSLLTDFGKEFSLSASKSSPNDWANTSSCSRERLIDESRNVAPSAYRVQNVQENLKLDLKSSFDNSSQSDRKQRSPKREKVPKSSKRRGSKGSASPKRESSKSKSHTEKKANDESPSSQVSMDFPSVTDSLLPKQGSTHHYNKPTWTEEPKTRVITQQPTSWNENPTFIGNARTNGIKSEMSKPAASASAAQTLPSEPVPEINMGQFTIDASPQNDKPLKFTDFDQMDSIRGEIEDKSAAGANAEGSGDAYNFLLDW